MEEKETIYNIKEETMSYAIAIEATDIDNFIAKENPIIIDLRGAVAYRLAHIKNSINITDIFFNDIYANGEIFDKDDKDISKIEEYIT